MNIRMIKPKSQTAFSSKNLLAASFFALLANLLSAQTVLRYVPSDADMVVTLNFASIEKKVNWQQLQQYDFYQAMLKDIATSPDFEGDEPMREFTEKMFTEPSSIGLDSREPIVFMMEKKGFDTYMISISKLGNKTVYEAAVQKLLSETTKPSADAPAGMNIWQQGEGFFGWNDEVVVEIRKQGGQGPSTEDWGYEDHVDPGFEWNYDEIVDSTVVVDEDYSEDWEEEDADSLVVYTPENGEDSLSFEITDSGFGVLEDTVATVSPFDWLVALLNKENSQSIMLNPQFMSAKSRTNDLHFWMDYKFLMPERGGWAAYPPMSATPQFNSSNWLGALSVMSGTFYGDTYLSMGLNFEDGRTALRTQLFFNKDVQQFYRRALDAKFNKKFLRYVKGGDEMFGYFYLNYNIKNTIEETKTLLYKIFDATPDYGQAASDALKILDIFIDDDAVGNLLKGDLMVAVSGIQTVETKTQTFDYDEDFNFTPKDTTIMKQVPVFTALASYGNGKDIQKFIDLGVHSKVLTEEGRFYKFAIPNMDGMEFFLAKHDGMLILTNNSYLMRQNLEKGFAKKLRLPKNHKKRLCENSSVMYWNIPNTMKAVMGEDSNSNIGATGYLNSIAKEFYSVEMTTSKKVENSMDSELFLNMTGKETNALQQFFNFVNDIYLEFIGGAKI